CVQGDLDFLAEAGHRLVDRVVDDLVDEVVEATRVDRADVHCGSFSNRLQAFEDLDLRGVVGGLFYHLFRNLLERVPVPSRSPSRRMVQVSRRAFINVRRPVSMEKTDHYGRGLFGVDYLNTLARSFSTRYS